MSRASVAPLSLDPKHVSCIRGRTVVTCSMCAGNAPRDSICSRCNGHGFNVFICATCNLTAVTAASSAKGAAVTNTSFSATSAASSATVSTSSSRGASVSGSPSNSIGAGAGNRSWGRSDRRDGHGPGGIGTRSSRGV